MSDTDSSRDWKRFPSLKPVTVYNINLVLLTISTHQLYRVSVNNIPHSRWRIPLTISFFSTLISPQNLLKALWVRVLLNCIFCIFCKWPISSYISAQRASCVSIYLSLNNKRVKKEKRVHSFLYSEIYFVPFRQLKI